MNNRAGKTKRGNYLRSSDKAKQNARDIKRNRIRKEEQQKAEKEGYQFDEAMMHDLLTKEKATQSEYLKAKENEVFQQEYKEKYKMNIDTLKNSKSSKDLRDELIRQKLKKKLFKDDNDKQDDNDNNNNEEEEINIDDDELLKAKINDMLKKNRDKLDKNFTSQFVEKLGDTFAKEGTDADGQKSKLTEMMSYAKELEELSIEELNEFEAEVDNIFHNEVERSTRDVQLQVGDDVSNDTFNPTDLAYNVLSEIKKNHEQEGKGSKTTQTEEQLQLLYSDFPLVAELKTIFESERVIDVVVIDMRSKCDWCSAFVIGTGLSQRHMSSVISRATDLANKYREAEDPTSSKFKVEARNDPDWQVLDAKEVVVHLFSEEARKKYDLEGLWLAENPFNLTEEDKKRMKSQFLDTLGTNDFQRKQKKKKGSRNTPSRNDMFDDPAIDRI